jgi:hypothetical protein
VRDASPHPRRRASYRELAVHGGAALFGSAVGLALVGTPVPGLLWRAAALSSALTLVIVALVRSIALGRAEWRRDTPSRTEYQRVVGRFAIAFVLVIAASS